MRRLLIAWFLVACQGTGSDDDPAPEGIFAEIQTDKGLITLVLAFDRTPLTCANFIGLAEGKIENDALPLGTPFYDGTKFHRVVPGHVIQAGQPANADARGPGYTFPNEIHPELSHDHAGALGMANGGPHTNSSQFYITLGDRSYLDGNYTVFGDVFQGMDVVHAIEADDVIQSIRIVRIGERAEAFQPDTEMFEQLVDAAQQRVVREAEQLLQREEAFVRENWPDATMTDAGERFVVTQAGDGEALAGGETATVRYRGRTIGELRFVSTGEGKPGFGNEPAAFAYEVGATRINPGVDAAIATMRRGERRTVIVPADRGYANRGFYGPNVAGEKRFVISPGTLLVYEIQIEPN